MVFSKDNKKKKDNENNIKNENIENKEKLKNTYSVKKVFSKIYKVFINILSVIAIIVIVFASIYLYQLKVQKKLYVDTFGYTILEVKSGSMEDEILIGDLVILKLINKNSINDGVDKEKSNFKYIKENLKINDIITFEKENHLITHRIVELNENELITKGDANNVEDKPISYNQIIGKVIYIIPNVGIWKKVFSEKQVLLPLLGGIVFLVIAILIDTEEIKKEEKDKDGKEKRKKIQKGKRFKK